MRLPRIDRKLVIRVAIAVLPLEFIALLGFFTCPIDVGYPAGTSGWWIAFGLAGVLVHYPALALITAYPIEPGISRNLVCFMIGYADLFFLALVLVLSYRYARERISSLSWV